MKNFHKQYNNYVEIINQRLSTLINISDINQTVAEAMKYSLTIGGKRIRPILAIEFFKLCGGGNIEQDIIDIACTIEMIHTYSLIHDDLPCIDNDSIRRGYPSCHIKFGPAFAVLAGDSLLIEPFNIISSLDNFSNEIRVNIINVLSKSIGYQGMIAGQNMDILLSNSSDKVTLDMLFKINNLKTGELIRAAAKIGCIVAGGNKEQIKMADKYAYNIGLAFQIIDDILDITGNVKILKKPIGSDNRNNKITYVDLLGVQKCKEKVIDLSNEAINIISSRFRNVDFMIDLTNYLLARDH